uniref:Transmembrane protein 8B n=1 Tax=Chelonoidis abingdonii TaxID=106734 RepID=A0A8C0IUA9_CHEAB
QVLGCRAGNRSTAGCPLWLTVRAKAPPLHNSSGLDCRERAPCQLALELPLWQHWYYLLLEKALGVPGPIHFQLTVQLTGESHGAGLWGDWQGNHPRAPGPDLVQPPLEASVCSKVPPEVRSRIEDKMEEIQLPFIASCHVVCASFVPTANYPARGLEKPEFEPCANVTAEVYLRTYLSPCIDDCGPYGQCKLLRTNNYLYAACECKAGWNGWGCTDSAEAFSYGFQLLATLLLCLSNLMFVPPVAIALRSHYLLEASVYVFTISTHACDQPGIAVFCIMEYDVLQFCDFLGSLMSVWVTVIAMARLQPLAKQVLYLLGAMLLSMALQLDRHGLWNLLGPSLFAVGIMAVAWVSIRRRHCYPPTWQRWAFYLCPGALIAAGAVLLYACVETEENYFYIHSIWHMLIAGSVGFLLPPRPKPAGCLGPLSRHKGCGYQLCINEQEELGLVGPATASISSVCAS